ncbi:alpha/beta fold hydrolase [Mycobacterium simiae]|uniref:alpha/beta fold hydrolase n=1 Tax=Mycobacterium simiae TaxID=1784 RepID=UPI0004272F89|nr:alpha/beta fold hydrolase [Mycobacterium simiae]PLV45734.1 alpha/beta hydrolase [Mycobacterium tuberculosis variant microti OV254]BBX43445.1 haloalkane dehalogenase 2 [Mycobacterium simiae]
MNAAPAVPDWLDTTIYPFDNHYRHIDGHTVHYIDEGSGPVLLLLHGNPSWSFVYRNIITELSTQFRCIALDYPGFGLSTAAPGYTFKPEQHSDVVERFITELGLTDIRLMVHDWGGPIGLGVAGRRPDLFHSLIIGNTWAWPAQDIPHVAMFSRIAGNPLSRWLIRRFNAFVVWLMPAGITHPLTPAEKAAYRGPFPTPKSRQPIAVFPREILASSYYLAQVESGLAKLADKPVLLVWGNADIGFRASERKRFEATFPRHHTRILGGAKHLIQECNPRAISDEIRAFERHPPQLAP